MLGSAQKRGRQQSFTCRRPVSDVVRFVLEYLCITYTQHPSTPTAALQSEHVNKVYSNDNDNAIVHTVQYSRNRGVFA